MTTTKTILVPTDFSVAAETALEHALALASKLGAKVVLLHAYALPIIGFPEGTMIPSAAIASSIISHAEKELAACVARCSDRGVEIVPLLKQADPREAILAASHDLSADLVVMGTHGRRGIARALIGSVAEAIVRVSHVPVMTVHAAA